jgi:DNA mismatch repair protein MutS
MTIEPTIKTTPMMKQYLSIKEDYKDCLLLFRMGDFYELFFEDAIIAAPILGIVLTRRGKTTNNQDVEMCGIPNHSSNIYIKKLIDKGYKVAICDQLETPEEAKKRGSQTVVKRDVVRVITPGTLTEDNFLDDKKANYLMSIVALEKELSLAYVDISTLEFSVISIEWSDLQNYLNMIDPSEIITSDCLFFDDRLKEVKENFKHKIVTFADSFFETKKNHKKLLNNFRLFSQASIAEFNNSQISCCGSLLEYISLTQKKDFLTLSFPKILHNKDYMIIDRSSQLNLEILTAKNENGVSLFSAIDRTVTNQGSRLLKQYLAFPSIKSEVIKKRLKLTSLFVKQISLHKKIKNLLQHTPDLERAISRLSIGRGSPNDLYVTLQTLTNADEIATILQNASEPILEKIISQLKQNKTVRSRLETLLIPRDIYLNQSDFINHSYNNELSQLYSFRSNVRNLLENIKDEYKQKTGINNLKIEYNNILGYYIEITKSHLDKITTNEFIHKQTMLNCSRFITEKLKEIEIKILTVNEKITTLESEIFNTTAASISAEHNSLLAVSKTLAFLDVISSFATIAVEKNYCEPMIEDNYSFDIKDGRHPVVEHVLSKKSGDVFIPNNCHLTLKDNIWIITGPNMAGKSTFLRQNAIIAILAHIGCYVPASSAQIGIIDRIFTRIGSGDDLSQGHSTFLVEMIETANILNQATKSSLIILDEIGRGTSTYDGLAIAFSCLEQIHNNIKCRTLFSTHYHEIIDLAKNLNHISYHTMKIKEWEEKIVFMHKIIEGVASKSYGINVAELAGIPKIVIARAKEVLQTLTNTQKEFAMSFSPSSQKVDEPQYLEILRNTKIDDMTPREALELLYKIKKYL